MMLFSHRKKAEQEFLEWCEKNNCSVCPFNVMGWLMGDGKHWLKKMTEERI